MQMHNGSSPLYRGPFSALATICREEGLVRGLYRGIGINYLKTLPHVAITLSLYDFIRVLLTAESD